MKAGWIMANPVRHGGVVQLFLIISYFRLILTHTVTCISFKGRQSGA